MNNAAGVYSLTTLTICLTIVLRDAFFISNCVPDRSWFASWESYCGLPFEEFVLGNIV